MPSTRHVPGVYVPTGPGTTVTHGSHVLTSTGIAGIAVKQQANSPEAGLVNPATIASAEPFYVRTKGEYTVLAASITGSLTRYVPIYITSGNALTTTVGSNTKFGRLTELAGERGLPSTKVRIDMDAKDSF